MMLNHKVTLSLNFLHCYFVEEAEYDDVFLKYKGKKIWPKKKKNIPVSMDSTTELNVEVNGIEIGQEIAIELWDFDWLSSNDHLGTFHLTVENIGGPYTTDMQQNWKETTVAKYTLEWETY